MSLRTPQTNASKFEPAPAGWHVARCFAVIDLGTHFDAKWDKETHLVRIGFELPSALREDGKPFAIYKRYTLSHHEKSRLRGDLEAWYGMKFNTAKLNEAGGFDLSKIIGRPAFLNIMHEQVEDTTYANIVGIGPLPKNMTCPDPINETILFSLSEFDKAIFDKLSDKTKQQIMESGEYKVMTGQIKAPPGYTAPAGNFEDMVDDIPF